MQTDFISVFYYNIFCTRTTDNISLKMGSIPRLWYTSDEFRGLRLYNIIYYVYREPVILNII